MGQSMLSLLCPLRFAKVILREKRINGFGSGIPIPCSLDKKAPTQVEALIGIDSESVSSCKA